MAPLCFVIDRRADGGGEESDSAAVVNKNNVEPSDSRGSAQGSAGVPELPLLIRDRTVDRHRISFWD